MYTISKEQIEYLMTWADVPDAYKEVQAMLQGLLAQPEGEPVAYADGAFGGRFTYKCLNPAMVLPENTAFFIHPAPFTPITAEDVHGDVVVNLWRIGVLTSTGTQGKEIVAKVVNAWEQSNELSRKH